MHYQEIYPQTTLINQLNCTLSLILKVLELNLTNQIAICL